MADEIAIIEEKVKEHEALLESLEEKVIEIVAARMHVITTEDGRLELAKK